MNKKSKKIFDDDSIDLIELLSILWKEKVLIIKSTIVFTLIGIIYSLSLKIYILHLLYFIHIIRVMKYLKIKD